MIQLAINLFGIEKHFYFGKQTYIVISEEDFPEPFMYLKMDELVDMAEAEIIGLYRHVEVTPNMLLDNMALRLKRRVGYYFEDKLEAANTLEWHILPYFKKREQYIDYLDMLDLSMSGIKAISYCSKRSALEVLNELISELRDDFER